MPYRVLHVTPFFPPDTGGMASHVYNVCRQLKKLDVETCIICPRHWRDHYSGDSEGTLIRSRAIYLPGWPYPTLRSVSIPLDLGRTISTVIKKQSFDIVHVHGHHYPFTWIAINSAYKCGIPSILTLHGTYSLNPYVQGGQTVIEDWLNRNFFPKILKKTTGIIGLTQQVTEYGKIIGTKSTKYFTVANGVDTDVYMKNLDNRQDYRNKYGIDPSAKVILFRGRFEHVKGVIEFVEAAKLLVERFDGEVEVVILGGGTLEGKVRNSIGSKKGIYVMSWQKSEEIHELYIASDIFILPSRFEAFGIVLLEAMNAGMHIVYTDVGGVSDVLRGYRDKTLLSEISTAEICKVLSELMSTDSGNKSDKDTSLAYARSFDWKNISLKLFEVYQEIRQKKQ